MEVINRFIRLKIRDGVPPFGSPTGYFEPYGHVDIMKMDQDLSILLMHRNIDCRPLHVELTREFNARITYRGMSYSDYTEALRQRRGEVVVYTT